MTLLPELVLRPRQWLAFQPEVNLTSFADTGQLNVTYRFLFQKLVLELCLDSKAVSTAFKNQQLLERSAVQEQISGMVGGSSTRLGSKK